MLDLNRQVQNKSKEAVIRGNKHEKTTAARIQLAAERCFLERGVRETTVEDILRESGVSRTTFYRNYPNIDAVALQVILKSGVDEHTKIIEKLKKDTPVPARLTQLLTEIILSATTRDWAGVIFNDKNALTLARLFLESQTTGVRQLSDSLKPLLMEAREAGLTRPNMKWIEVAEWLLRCIWLLIVVPQPGGWKREDLHRYVATYIVPAVIADQPTQTSKQIFSLDEQEKISQLLDTAASIKRQHDNKDDECDF